MQRKIITASSWGRISRAWSQKIEKPQFVGILEGQIEGRQMRVVKGSSINDMYGWEVVFFLLVDEWDGVIADVRYQCFGPALLLAVAETASAWLMRKNYHEAQRIQEKDIRGENKKESLEDIEPYFSCIASAIEEAASLCEGIALPDTYIQTPIQMPSAGERYPGWETLSQEEQLHVIESVIAEDIRPYIELDAGGIHVVSLTDGKTLVIAYSGACTTCYSSVGSTLQAIQQILSDKIHPDIRVIPDSSFLSH